MSIESGIISFMPGTTRRLLEDGRMKNVTISEISHEHAKKFFGENFFGPEEISNTFGVKILPKDIQPILLSDFELRRAKELRLSLVLRVPITIDYLFWHMKPKFDKEGRKILVKNTDKRVWFEEQNDSVFDSEIPRAGWAFVSEAVLDGTKGVNYLGQSNVIAEYLSNILYADHPLPLQYQEAVAELRRNESSLGSEPVKKINLNALAHEFNNLKLTQLTRHTLSEAIYDFLLFSQYEHKKYTVRNLNTWTATMTQHDQHVMVHGNLTPPRARGLRLPAQFATRVPNEQPGVFLSLLK